MKKSDFSHAFVICAYKESEYLEECIISLMNQTRKSEVIICTSTDCEYIRTLANKYNLQIYVREGESDIQKDWNFGCECTNAQWVTVAHQDDCYTERYAETLYQTVKDDEDALLFFTDYLPIKNGKVGNDINCRLRRLLRSPMKVKSLSDKTWAKKLILCLGCSICCPAVAYNRKLIKGDIFDSHLHSSLDWDTFYKFAKRPGKFVYVDKPLTYYRIHRQATSMRCIENFERESEDRYMFQQFWPKPIAKLLMSLYKNAYKIYYEEEK